MKSCLECVYCKLNPYGKGKDDDYNGYHCNWYGKKICGENELEKIITISSSRWEFFDCLKRNDEI